MGGGSVRDRRANPDGAVRLRVRPAPRVQGWGCGAGGRVGRVDATWDSQGAWPRAPEYLPISWTSAQQGAASRARLWPAIARGALPGSRLRTGRPSRTPRLPAPARPLARASMPPPGHLRHTEDVRARLTAPAPAGLNSRPLLGQNADRCALMALPQARRSFGDSDCAAPSANPLAARLPVRPPSDRVARFQAVGPSRRDPKHALAKPLRLVVEAWAQERSKTRNHLTGF